MFEIGFSEICMVALVALLVIGPEKLPKVARMTGFWLNKTRRTIEAVKQEINEEFQAEELRQALQKQADGGDLKKLLNDIDDDLNAFDQTIESELDVFSKKRTLKKNERN